jgi:hypothetical protein
MYLSMSDSSSMPLLSPVPVLDSAPPMSAMSTTIATIGTNGSDLIATLNLEAATPAASTPTRAARLGMTPAENFWAACAAPSLPASTAAAFAPPSWCARWMLDAVDDPSTLRASFALSVSFPSASRSSP